MKLSNDTKRLLREAKEDPCESTSVRGAFTEGKRWFREDVKVSLRSESGAFPLNMLWLFQYFPNGQLAVNALTMTSPRVVYLTRYSCNYSKEANVAEDKAWQVAGWEVIERKAEEV